MASVVNRGWTSDSSGAVNLTREADRLVSSRDERIDWQKPPLAPNNIESRLCFQSATVATGYF